jgi:hypothetical protein
MVWTTKSFYGLATFVAIVLTLKLRRDYGLSATDRPPDRLNVQPGKIKAPRPPRDPVKNFSPDDSVKLSPYKVHRARPVSPAAPA